MIRACRQEPRVLPHLPAIEVDTASRLQLTAGQWDSLLEGLCARFPSIARNEWLERF